MSADEYWKRGNSFFEQERYQEAMKEYEKALRIDPNNGFARKSLETALAKYPQYHEEKKEKGTEMADEVPKKPAKDVSPVSGE
ncbi:MAG: tetratricopeptide repeat protein [Promethearchaeota archaeon]